MVQIGGEKGDVLIWDVEQSCLMYDIPAAHVGNVLDCAWSGDSRLLLSAGAGGQICGWACKQSR